MGHKLDKITSFLLGLAYVMVCAGLMAVILYDEPSVWKIALLSFLFYGVANLIYLSRALVVTFFALSIAGSIFITYVCWVDSPFSAPVLYIVEGVITLWNAIINGISYEKSELLFAADATMVFFILFVSVFVYNLFYKSRSFYTITILVLFMFIFSYYMSAYESRILFTLFLAFTILAYLNKVYLNKKKTGAAFEGMSLGYFLLSVIPLAGIVLVVLLSLPKNDLPIQWPWMDRKINGVIAYFEQQFSSSDTNFFSLASSGFASRDTRNLGGSASPDYTEVMKVKSDRHAYLRGATYLNYENTAWTRFPSQSSYVNERDLRETKGGWGSIPIDDLFAAISLEDKAFLHGLAKEEYNEVLLPQYSMEIEFQNIKTNNLFLPLKLIMPILGKNNEILPYYELTDGIIVSNDVLKKGDIYQFDYIQPMYGEELLKKALKYSYTGLYMDAWHILQREHLEIVKYRDIYKKASDLPAEEYLKIANMLEKFFNSPAVRSEFGSVSISDVIRRGLISSPDDPYILENITGTVNEDGTVTISDFSLSPNLHRLSQLNQKIEEIEYYEREAKSITDIYTVLPDTIPQRVRDLAHSLTVDQESAYEKIIAIEKYLRENYTYTLTPGGLPEGEDFADYFLFEQKEGYCTYYATSMVVLLRCLGIPSRYVEGYILPAESVNNTYTVTNFNAHAWVEVYLEGFGWLSFEPTSNYSGVMEYTTSTNVSVNGNYNGYLDIFEEPHFDSDFPEYTPISEEIEAESKFLSPSFIIFGIVFLCIIINLAAILISELRIRLSSNEKKVLRLYMIMMKWLSKVGCNININESPREFAGRIDQYYYFPVYSFKEITEVFSKIRYGGHKISSGEYEMVKDFYSYLKKEILKELGFKRYIPLRWIFLSI